MKNTPFYFKQFSVLHNKSTMKVGTDAILASILSLQIINNKEKIYNILDIGTGCGVISLILAQNLKNSTITGIDIDTDSVHEANLNFNNSPWNNRLFTYNIDLYNFHKQLLNNNLEKLKLKNNNQNSLGNSNHNYIDNFGDQSYNCSNGKDNCIDNLDNRIDRLDNRINNLDNRIDHLDNLKDIDNNENIDNKLFDIIITNPPYFVNSLKSKNNKRNKARHTDSLPFDVLTLCVSNLLNKDGMFFCILPFEATKTFLQFATLNSLHCFNFTKIYSKITDNTPIRSLLAFSKENIKVNEDSFYIYLKDGEYTNEYLNLTKDLLFLDNDH